MKGKEPQEEQGELGLERLVFFSDAVFAIAITLLALELRVPVIDPARAAAELPGELLALWPKFMAFAISFLVIGSYWQQHHLFFRYINRFDGRLLLLNLCLLFSVAFLPFPTAVLGTYSGHTPAVVFYAGAVALTGLLSYVLWRHASDGHRLVTDALSGHELSYLGRRVLVAPLAFLVSIPIGLLNPGAAQFSWGALIAVALALVNRSRAQLPAAGRPSRHHPARHGGHGLNR